ncbi:conjugal transfer protein TraG N-terminal domain-containing protein [Photobacterium phosphoreum]|uniref:conjugal transfer protein TraG N-terminal domain-containing protein n=1 Tax=Photobacterium phosphoreum TaxID=659 RepID=UPI0015E6D198|nr:conjugal transfer protein TraG N-terminal domain-containing protein [Photobacterium phosphoreum]
MMTMVANDLSDVFMLPLSTYIADQIWSVIEDTKLFLVPFIIMMIVAIGQAKRQGVDEGNAAIQAYKAIEVSTISMFLIMLVACKPMSVAGNFTATSISVKNYSCLIGGGAVVGGGRMSGLGIFNSIDKNEFLNNPYIRQVPPTSPTLLGGLLNQFGIGITNAAIASLPCTPHESLRYAYSKVDTYEPDKPKLKTMVKMFNNQCYKQGLNRRAINESSKTNGSGTINYSYDSPELMAMYHGNPTAKDGETGTMQFVIDKDYWTGSNPAEIGNNSTQQNLDPRKTIVTCADAAREIQRQIGIDVASGAAHKEFATIQADSSAAGQRKSEVLVYNNIISGKGSVYNRTTAAISNSSAGQFVNSVQNGIQGGIGVLGATKDLLWNHDPSRAFNVINGGVGEAMTLLRARQVHNYQMIAPLVISIIKGVLIIAMPLILFLTGFNGKTLLTLIVAYVAIDFSKFFLEIGNLIDEALLSFREITAMSDASSAGSDQLNVLAALTTVGQYSTYMLVGVWYMFAGWMGVKMIAPMQMAQSTAEDTNQGAQAAAQLGTKAATTAVKGG